ncbi:MAG: Xaa-Pro aminopeptidase [Porticoccaceae bacterium]|nr:Xaa-Pro aminopeptidase [Porticoccaceae bacterium]
MITKKEYASRRSGLINMMEPRSIAIVASGPKRVRSKDTFYAYKQDTTFSYLSGFPEPQSVLVLIPDRKQGQFILFCQEKDRSREIWDGSLHGPEGACHYFEADDAFPITDIDDILPGMLEGRDRVYYGIGKDTEFDNRLMGWVNDIRARRRKGAMPPGEFIDIDHFVNEMRLIKTSIELKLMKNASSISASAHRRAMRVARPGMYEYQLQAEIEHEFLYQGATSPAYTTIVGGGKNACVLHYIKNQDLLLDGDLVLVDAGCEYRNYCADITRTFPVNGRFTESQASIYDIVLEAQTEAIKSLAPGKPYNTANDVTIKTITQGLVDLGILSGDVSDLIEIGSYRDFYMHQSGHWLGMDVHDVGDYRLDQIWRDYEAGMVVTVEPGIYISPDNLSVAEKWRGIGVRIEDNVVLTRNGCECLTDSVPKRRVEIEKLMIRS